jgi:hypothetical protein
MTARYEQSDYSGGDSAHAAAGGTQGSCLAAVTRCLWLCEAFQDALSDLRLSDAAGAPLNCDAHTDSLGPRLRARLT